MHKIIVANWKMNGSLIFIETFMPSLHEILSKTPHEIILCPPFPYLSTVNSFLKGTKASLGAQNCHKDTQGPFTGEVSASMLADLGCQTIIIGHSERRIHFAETDEIVKSKAMAAHNAGMTAIICIGEDFLTKQAGKAIETIKQQLSNSLPPTTTPQNTFIAYEPIWAIGTGVTASDHEIIEMHQALHSALEDPISLLYGGSVTDQNAQNILSLPHVDGVLVGGASLKVDSFKKIAMAGASS